MIKARVGGASGPYLKHFQGHHCYGVPGFGTFSRRQAAPYFPKNTSEWNPPTQPQCSWGLKLCSDRKVLTAVHPRPVLQISRHGKHWCWLCPLFSYGNPEGLVSNPRYKLERKGATSEGLPVLASDTQWHASSPKKTLTFDIWHRSSCACGRGSVPGESGVSCRASHGATPQCTSAHHRYGMEYHFRLQFCQWCHRGRKCPGKVGRWEHFLVSIQIWFGYSVRVV